ncbi:N-lysine methyltransferase KMT5A-B [Holothuria leucospilota]|uniref:N-lysine methyltransferase KMT5A-B n=1 Tax=Holothuria leucospilota TaxID=206669 RepID=A0A9Q0YD57_HOLLE|nr:N-lysine methyltransferase KMT5A-B [Holothuria leucospilota]
MFSFTGRGVVAKTTFERGEFLLQYSGSLKSAEEANTLEDVSSSGFRYFFNTRKRNYGSDATAGPTSGPTLGRLVNHGDRHEVKCKMKVVEVNNAPTLCLFAIKDILAGQELLYDYGISDLPWKSKVLTKAGSTELERPSVTVNANVANEEVSTDLNSLTPINSRNKFFSTNAKSSVADAVNPDKTEKDGNKSTDSKLADKDPTNEAISSDLEETLQIVRPI